MDSTPTLNWMPKSHEEFKRAALEGCVKLNIMHTDYTWLYNNIIPWKPNFFLGKSYNKKLMDKMIADEEVFKKVHDHGIDLILSKNPS